MTWYANQDNAWTNQSSPPSTVPSIQVRAEEGRGPEVRFLEDRREFFHLPGADPRPDTDTTHTVAAVDVDAAEGTLLFAVHAENNDLTFEDLRPADHRTIYSDDALEGVQSSLNEILIPVYIDDVISDLSEGLPGLVTLHTAQYEGGDRASWTYFRTSTFEDGELTLEEEHGSM